MTSENENVTSTLLMVVVIFIVIAVVFGGVLMAGMMGFGMMGGGSWGGWLLFLVPVGLLVLLVLLLPGVVSRRASNPAQTPQQPFVPQIPPMGPQSQSDPAIHMLEHRLARGEISQDEFMSTLETLRVSREL